MTFKEIINLLQDKLGEGLFVEVNEEVRQPYVVVNREKLLPLCQQLYQDSSLFFDYFSCLTCVDNGINENTIELIYHLYSIALEHHFIVKVVVERDFDDEEKITIPSVESIWKSANWHEREAYDLFGVKFSNHPDLRRILLPANWEGHPLRKDYQEQAYYHGIKVEY